MRTVIVPAAKASIGSRVWLLAMACGLLFSLLGCAGQPALTATAGNQPTDAPTPISPPQRSPGEPVPAPVGPVVLTMTGKIGQRNDGAQLRLDAAQLDQLGRVQVAVFDPWVKKDLQLQGTWLNELIDVAQPTPEAQKIHITALDDYQIDLSLAEIRAGGILLATKTGAGEPIPIADGGPLRIVFVGGVPSGASADQWIWNLAMIDVR
jgi:hypothetical protein